MNKYLFAILCSVSIGACSNRGLMTGKVDSTASITYLESVICPASPSNPIIINVRDNNNAHIVFYSYKFSDDIHKQYRIIIHRNDTVFNINNPIIDSITHIGTKVTLPGTVNNNTNNTYKIWIKNHPSDTYLQDLDVTFMPSIGGGNKYSAHLDYANETMWPFNSNTDGVIVIVMNDL